MEKKKVTIPDLWQRKREGKKITKINLHDFNTCPFFAYLDHPKEMRSKYDVVSKTGKEQL
jgi:hypothetical protein